ncbi:LysR family transcriptional regulator [Microbacterium sp. P01]|uniref:LysR family transcriptional regulator n=1 Tax=Microbacterium sp. P01 TaxID=3366261 RepID=UPI00366ABD6D
MPEPGHCHNRPTTEASAIRSRCGADLTATGELVSADDATREAQRAILRVVASGVGEFGIYADGRPSTIQVLSDMSLLSRAARQALVDDQRFEWLQVGSIDRSVIAAHPRTGKVDLRPSNAAEVALGNTIAFEALQTDERVADLLRGRVSVHTALDHYSPPLRDHVSRALGRVRRPTATLQSLKLSAADPEARAAKLPAVLWPEVTARLAPRRLDAEIAGGALSAAVVFVGTQLTHGSAIKLLDPDARGRQVSHVMRSLGRNAPEADTIRAIARLASFLDGRSTPIDFARRRSLDYAAMLPRDEWVEICRVANVLSGGDRRWQAARAHLYALVSGNRLSLAPFADDPGFPSFVEVAHFRSGLPGNVADALASAAAHFIRDRGVDEPVAWLPGLDVVGDLPVAADATIGRWPTARPARAMVKPARVVAAYSAGRSVREIALEHGVARQTVGRVLSDEGVETRTGRQRAAIDPEWLRQRYLIEHHTIPEIAAEVGVTMTTINRHLEAAGIPRRARGAASRATAIRVDPRAGNSPLLRRILVGQDSLQRAERFLVVARHDTITAAAREIGVTLSILASQMKRLGADAGGPLITRAMRAQPLTLTKLGAEVRRELKQAFDEST